MCRGWDRVLLNILYLMVETIPQEDPADPVEWRAARETFKTELGERSVAWGQRYFIRSV